MTAQELKERIARAFSTLLRISQTRALKLLPSKLIMGKVYEAYVLSVVCEKLKNHEGCHFILKGGNKLVLKTSPGPINRQYPWIEVYRKRQFLGEIFTDIEFLTLSYQLSSHSQNIQLTSGHFHELDIVLTRPNITNGNRPLPCDIFMAIECKNTIYTKSLLREILGIRRELSLLSNPKRTRFNNWPRVFVPTDPPSCLLVYTTSLQVRNYQGPGDIFGIDFFIEQF